MFILIIHFKFGKFQPRYSYETHSYKNRKSVLQTVILFSKYCEGLKLHTVIISYTYFLRN